MSGVPLTFVLLTHLLRFLNTRLLIQHSLQIRVRQVLLLKRSLLAFNQSRLLDRAGLISQSLIYLPSRVLWLHYHHLSLIINLQRVLLRLMRLNRLRLVNLMVQIVPTSSIVVILDHDLVMGILDV